LISSLGDDMSKSKRALFVTASAAAIILLLAPVPSRAQVGSLPAAVQQQLQAPNADVQAIVLAAAQSTPAVATAALQAAINLLSGNPSSAANAMKAFADMAAQLAGPGAGHNAALAAALSVAVRNASGAAQNAGLVNGEASAIVAAALAEANTVLENAEVQQAILDGAPGTDDSVQATAEGGPFAGFTPPGPPFAPPGPPGSIVR
jgi:hypothetical protein